MIQSKGRPEDTVSVMSAGFASARALRAEAERLIALADEQMDAAREAAHERWGEERGETIFLALSDDSEASEDDVARVHEVPGLAEAATPPWAAVQDMREAPGPVPEREPAHVQAPAQPTAQPRPVTPPPAPVVAVATPTALAQRPTQAARSSAKDPPVPAEDIGRYGVPVRENDLKAARRIVAEARQKAGEGDAALIAIHDVKWVGIHQWRRDLYRAAFAEHSTEAGVPLDRRHGLSDGQLPADSVPAETLASPPDPVHRLPVNGSPVDLVPVEPVALHGAPGNDDGPPRADAGHGEGPGFGADGMDPTDEDAWVGDDPAPGEPAHVGFDVAILADELPPVEDEGGRDDDHMVFGDDVWPSPDAPSSDDPGGLSDEGAGDGEASHADVTAPPAPREGGMVLHMNGGGAGLSYAEAAEPEEAPPPPRPPPLRLAPGLGPRRMSG